jgi:hypothetical protein
VEAIRQAAISKEEGGGKPRRTKRIKVDRLLPQTERTLQTERRPVPPVDGWITNLSLRQSDYAIVGQVVDAHSFWIAGYFDVDSLTWAINVPNARANATGVAEVSRCSPGSGSPSTSLCGYLSTLFLKTSGSCKA